MAVDIGQSDWRLAAQVATCVLATYHEMLGSLDTLLDRCGLSADFAAEPERLVAALPYDSLPRLTGLAMGLMAGQANIAAGRAPLSAIDWNVILYSLSGARTLREAIRRCSECFEAIDWRCGRMQLGQQDGSALLQLDAMRRTGGSTACLIDLFGLVEIHGLLSWLIGQQIPADPVALDHDRESYAKLDLPELPFPMRFEAGWSGFGFDPAFLDHPLIRSADELATRPRSSLLFQGRSTPAGPSLADQIREIALRALRELHDFPPFAAVAAMTGQSEATLRRRLCNEGTNYRRIKESCRREVSLDLLRRTDLGVEEIATWLAYCDSDAFRQAFRKWVGTTPTEYRRQARGR